MTHRSMTLATNSPYLDRIDPVTRKKFKAGLSVIICEKAGEVLSVDSLKATDSLCPFCQNYVDGRSAPTININKKQPAVADIPSHPNSSFSWIPFFLILGLIAIIGLVISSLSSTSSRNNIVVPSNNSGYSQSNDQEDDLPMVQEPASTKAIVVFDPTPTDEPSSCPGAPTQRVDVGKRGYVCTKNDRLIVRDGPGKQNSEITRIEPGTYFRIIEGPVCANNWSWWSIKTDAGIKGWVAEGGDNIDPYFICPQGN